MFWYILIAILLLLVLWIMLAPVIFRVDTQSQKYYVKLPAIFKVQVVPSDEEIIYIRGRVLFIPWRINPLTLKTRRKDPREKKKRRKLNLRSGNAALFKRLLHAFRIRVLKLDLDTDDFLLNAWLVPVFSGINRDNIQMQVNFQGKASLSMDVRTRIGTLFWILVSNKFKSVYQS